MFLDVSIGAIERPIACASRAPARFTLHLSLLCVHSISKQTPLKVFTDRDEHFICCLGLIECRSPWWAQPSSSPVPLSSLLPVPLLKLPWMVCRCLSGHRSLCPQGELCAWAPLSPVAAHTSRLKVRLNFFVSFQRSCDRDASPSQTYGSNVCTNLCYLKNTGGVNVPVYQGSRSTFASGTLGGHQGRALQAGDVLPLFAPQYSSDTAVGTVCYATTLTCGLYAYYSA